MDNETRTTLILPPDLAAMVDDYWHIRRLNTRNEAIRTLLRIAFDTEEVSYLIAEENRR
jgi:metal-responsive CopG/Arc/MetJ family transcriptional regulator